MLCAARACLLLYVFRDFAASQRLQKLPMPYEESGFFAIFAKGITCQRHTHTVDTYERLQLHQQGSWVLQFER